MPAPSLVYPIPSRSCCPILELSLFPGIVTRSSCVWLQTEQKREPGACVCVPAVAQATRGQPGAAKTTGGRGRAHGTAALGWHGQPSLPPPGWVSGQRGSHCSVPLNTTRPRASVRTGFYCRARLQRGSAASFGLGFTKAVGGHGYSARRPLPMARQHQALPGCMPGLGREHHGSTGTNGTARSEPLVLLGKRQSRAAPWRGHQWGRKEAVVV